MNNIKKYNLDYNRLFSCSSKGEDEIKIISKCLVEYGHIIQIKRKKLLIVFVPGIMASRLMNDDHMIWDPDSIPTMIKFLGMEPIDRQALLLHDYPLTVPGIDDGYGKIPKHYIHALERGWNTVCWKYYGRLLENLENWTTCLKALIDIKVYAFGYDWLQSNSVSGDNLYNKLQELLSEIEKSSDDVKIIFISHSMGGLVVRHCINNFTDLNIILGVIHGAQPSVGAPAAYRRQKAGFEAHSFIDGLVRLILGKDGPNVRAIFPYRSGPLELLPCQYYKDIKLKADSWFSYDTFKDGQIESVSITSDNIYNELYLKFDDEYYYGMLNRNEISISLELLKNRADENSKNIINIDGADYTLSDVLDRISFAASFHDNLNKGFTHTRTIQLFSRGILTSCAVHWKLQDITDTIKNFNFSPSKTSLNIAHWDENIRKALPQPIDKKNDYYELRWIKKDWTIGDIIITSRRGGKLIYGKDIQNELGKSYDKHRIALCTLTKPADEGDPDLNNKHWSSEGDGTVPIASVIGLQTSIKGWPEDLQPLLPSYTYGEKNAEATSLASNAEHSEFFNDPDVIEKTKKIIYNLCVAWLKGDIE